MDHQGEIKDKKHKNKKRKNKNSRSKNFDTVQLNLRSTSSLTGEDEKKPS